jgi:hypothetical protein
MLAGGVLYLVGMFAVTMVFNCRSMPRSPSSTTRALKLPSDDFLDSQRKSRSRANSITCSADKISVTTGGCGAV